jgi:hypothetical protein
MTDAEVIAAIRQRHLKANIAEYEDGCSKCNPRVIRWDLAFVDRGGSLFGPGPYLHVPVILLSPLDLVWIRVYAPARLRRRLAREWKKKD